MEVKERQNSSRYISTSKLAIVVAKPFGIFLKKLLKYVFNEVKTILIFIYFLKVNSPETPRTRFSNIIIKISSALILFHRFVSKPLHDEDVVEPLRNDDLATTV